MVEGSEGDWRHDLPSVIQKAYGTRPIVAKVPLRLSEHRSS